jgi:hypothetical protein
MDLLADVWRSLDDAGRDRLAAEIIAGPPNEMLERIDETDRERSRDRRIFDRLTILERVREPPITAALLREQERLRARYPNWEAQEGERAHFSTWVETRWGPETRYKVDDLKTLEDPALIDVLCSEQELREGLLEEWRQLALTDASRTLAVLEQMAHSDDPGPADLWRRGLWGLRESAKDEVHQARLLALLLAVPDALFQAPDFADAAADVLDSLSRTAGRTAAFWRVFDRTLPSVASLPVNAEEPQQRGEWVSLAINRPLGRLAGAFFDAMFGRGLKVGQGIPEDLRARLQQLVRPGDRAHRLARVIAASRLSYLFAVDSDWTNQSLLPAFGWDDEEEALALWQGFAWQARIDSQLWAALKPNFLPIFTVARLDQLGDFRNNLGQLLVLVSVEFDASELPREETRNAIRAMPDEMRSSAVAWLASYLEQHAAKDGELVADVDAIWATRVAPWIQRVWPADPACRTPATSEQFGVAVMTTNAAFGEAIRIIEPLVVRTNGFRIIHHLDNSTHPDKHPNDTLFLLDLLVEPDAFGVGDDTLRRVLERIGGAAPELRNEQVYRRWDDWLRIRGL